MKILLNWWRESRKAREAERTRRELRALPDRTLRDLGLERCQVELLFRE